MAEKHVKIIAVGDVCPGDYYLSLGDGVRSISEKYGSDFIFEKVKKIISQGDISFCNLEGTLSDLGLNKESFKSFVFRGHPNMAECLKDTGFDIVNIANNHILQHGESVFKDTLHNINKAGLESLGIKANNNDKYSSLPIVKECNGLKVGFLGYSLVPEQHYPSESLPYAMSSLEEITKDINFLKSSVDFVIVSCHYGIEHINRPSPFGVEFAHRLIDAGAHVFLGHHSHVFQPVEKYKNGVIIYSLGNFVFDQLWDNRYIKSGIAEITLRNSGIIEVDIHPVRINMTRQPEITSSNNTEIYENHDKLYQNDIICQRESQNYSFYSQVYKIEKYLTFKKILFFILHLPFGHSRLKLDYILKKIISKIAVSKN